MSTANGRTSFRDRIKLAPAPLPRRGYIIHYKLRDECPHFPSSSRFIFMSSLPRDINEAFVTQFRFTTNRISRCGIKPREFRRSGSAIHVSREKRNRADVLSRSRQQFVLGKANNNLFSRLSLHPETRTFNHRIYRLDRIPLSPTRDACILIFEFLIGKEVSSIREKCFKVEKTSRLTVDKFYTLCYVI